MRAVLLVLTFLSLTNCREAEPAPLEGKAASTDSVCQQQLFEESRFTVCRTDGLVLSIRSTDARGEPLRSFSALSANSRSAENIQFAMNAGMFDDEGRAIGLLVEDGRELHAINRREGGGNFHLLPNGVFVVRQDGKTEVVPSDRYRHSDGTRFATQSGPMLVIDGALHPKFDPDGDSRFVRNGVGVDGRGEAAFVISEEPVSFGKLARFFRDELRAPNALYFDGSVSSLWDPANGRQDSFALLGPMVVAAKPAE